MGKKFFFPALCVGLLLLTCTTSDKISGEHPSTTIAMIVGVIYQPDGHTPATSVRVIIRPKNALADTGATTTAQQNTIDTLITDNSGTFTIDTIDTGCYAIEAEDWLGNTAMKAPVIVSNPESTIFLSDTLKPAGAITGTIVLSHDGNIHNTFVLAYGLDRLAIPDSSGRFMFGKLAEGTYRLHIITSFDNYGEIDTAGIKVMAGVTTELGTLQLPFTGIPTPKNVRVTYDTLNQNVTITWGREDTGLVQGFNIFRKKSTDGLFGLVNKRVIVDTNFVDSLTNGLEKGASYHYYIVGVDKYNNPGQNSISVAVTIFYYVDAGSDTTFRVGDAVVLKGCVNRAVITPVEYQWNANGTGLNDFNLTNTDSLAWTCSDSGTYTITFSVKDVTNRFFVDTVKIRILSTDTSGVPPAPRNVGLAYDTLKQCVTLRWSKNYEGDVASYNVYRRNISLNTVLTQINTTPISDTLYKDSTGTLNQTYEYRIAAVDNGASEGTKSAAVSIKVVSSALVTTSIALNALGTINDTASINDTIKIIANYSNVGRQNKKISWYNSGDSIPLRVVNGTSFTGSDTLPYLCASTGNYVIIVNIEDAGGSIWRDSIHVVIIRDIPTVRILSNCCVLLNSPVTFSAFVVQKFGYIVKYRWNNGLSSGWVESDSSTFQSVFSVETVTTVSVAAISDDGDTAEASITVRAIPSPTDPYPYGSVYYSKPFFATASSNDNLNALYNENGGSLKIQIGDIITVSVKDNLGIEYDQQLQVSAGDNVATLIQSELISVVCSMPGGGSNTAQLNANGTIGIINNTGTPIIKMQVHSTNLSSDSCLTDVLFWRDTILGGTHANSIGALRAPATSTDLLSGTFNSTGQRLGLEDDGVHPDVFNVSGTIGFSPIAKSLTYDIFSAMRNLLDEIKSAFNLPETDSTLQNNPSVSINAAGSNDSIPDGAIVIRGQKGCCNTISNPSISATNGNSNATAPDGFNANMIWVRKQIAHD